MFEVEIGWSTLSSKSYFPMFIFKYPCLRIFIKVIYVVLKIKKIQKIVKKKIAIILNYYHVQKKKKKKTKTVNMGFT